MFESNIPEFPNYRVTPQGAVFNRNGVKLKPETQNNGYLRVSLSNGKVKHKRFLVHRLVAQVFIPNPNKFPQVNHLDQNKQNNDVSNLEWVTRSENEHHAYVTGLRDSPLGEKNPRCILSRDQVDFIKTYYIPRDRDYGAKALSKRFGVACQTICAVASGQNWKD